MFRSIRGIIETNITMLTNLRQISHQVYSAASQLSNGAQSLASGSNEQTATLEHFSQVIRQVQEQAEDNVFKSGAMLVSIEENMDVMEKIISDMERMSTAMDDITVSSQKVASVIHVIEDIAFQTNILSLNASVEAARAGNNGKGFAVVADEVKELASKSAEAARETAALIQTNIETVETGNGIVEATKLSVTDIERMTRATQQNMSELNDASVSQSTVISEITTNIGQLTTVAQSNAAMSEEYSASAEQLTSQSEQLTSIIGKFKLRD
jgi:methyl-accepting chemotaxis protein